MKFSIKDISKKFTEAGLEVRDSQFEMIDCVQETVKKNGIACIEAPTGTGKTLAYALGVLSSKKDTQTLIISTATTALQDQFLHQDLPLLEKIIEQKLNVVVAKGRRRYVCDARLMRAEQFIENMSELSTIESLRDDFIKRRWNGELDSLPIELDHSVWQKISTDASGCAAGKCDYFNDCQFFNKRKKMHSADIVVTNHNLLLSDLELGGGVLLPEMKNNIYVLDECHHFPEKSLAHFAKQAAVMRSVDWINNVSKTVNKAALHVKVSTSTVEELNETTHQLVKTLKACHETLQTKKSDFSEEILRILPGETVWLDFAGDIIQQANKIASLCDQIDLEKVQSELAQPIIGALNFIIERSENLRNTWLLFKQHIEQKTELPVAVWFKLNHDQEFTLHASPINVSDAIKHFFWEKCSNAVILCSATIRALGSSQDFLRKLGLKDNKKVISKNLTSPFDYSRSFLFLPAMKEEPAAANQANHLSETIDLLPQLILKTGGTLVLFTSRYAMQQVLAGLPIEFKINILVQGDSAKSKLIERHKTRIDRNDPSILFGLVSFAEGIDLPGNYCQHVIIHKIPFAVPSDPIAKTREEWLKKHKGDAFKLVSLPEASIKLTQYVGRLLRHENDTGIVTILDKRLYTKQYGKLLLNNLPEFSKVINQSIEEFKRLSGFEDWFSEPLTCD